jgi:ATP-dependent helicase/nuclease subunit A
MSAPPVSPRDQANAAQLQASDPFVSAFVDASAGSGKTKLLTDRLLRLMLEGVPPERIQCLTFTKAGAAEMALRLSQVLGRWVTMPDEALSQALRALRVEPTDTARALARSLFARVLDLPGGMRIGTLHAFCQSLLRRFPLEAQVSPHFRLADERDAADARGEAREDMLARAEDLDLASALTILASRARIEDFGNHLATLNAHPDRLTAARRLGPDLPAAQRRALGVNTDNEAVLLETAVMWQGERDLHAVLTEIAANGSPAVQKRATTMLDWLGRPEAERARHWEDWVGCLLKKASHEPYSDTTLVNKSLGDKRPDLLNAMRNEAKRVARVDDQRRALWVAEASVALARLAGPILDAYGARKDQAGMLDYDDLIGRARELLREPGAAWVLYKLDGGLDHVLLDEAQDTSPAQWEITRALIDEFFVGEGARHDETRRARVPRGVFAVGDPKQSIFSFQGADMRSFETSRAALADRVRTAGRAWRDVPLNVSFRSTAPVLALVDAVFDDPLAREGVTRQGQNLGHVADRARFAGRVELWPLSPATSPPEAAPWTIPDRNLTHTSAEQQLIDYLARWIRDATDGRTMLESRGDPIRPGDIMVLPRRRGTFAAGLVRALKALGVPVAGVDRMVLTEQLAVRDMLDLCEALLLPDDDLTLAGVLTSPLGGLDDDDLMALAIDRPGSLWDALRARRGEDPRWDAFVAFFTALLARVDFVTPHTLLTEALGPLGGRARLFSRLGAEAAEPITELLNAALTHAGTHPPSLQGFLHWLRQGAAEVKRESEGGGDEVRIMTAHGAKGLQAPIVIVPDTVALPRVDSAIVWPVDPVSGVTVPVLTPRGDLDCAETTNRKVAARREALDEYNRLLYVALTRAEDRLVVCGWSGKSDAPKDESWYAAVARGFERLGAARESFAGPWGGEACVIASANEAGVETRAAATPPEIVARISPPTWFPTAPLWTIAPPPAEPARPRPLAPSRPEGVEMGEVPAATSPLLAQGGIDRFRRGRIVHALLQHVPDVPAKERNGAIARYLAAQGMAADDPIGAEVMAIVDHPILAPLFGPAGRAEVPLTGVLGDTVIGGLVDRLAVLEDSVLLADFKTNRDPPTRAEDTPVAYLRQMASYRAVLRRVFPNRTVLGALIWTRAARVMTLDDALLDTHEPRFGGELDPAGARAQFPSNRN